MFKRKSDLLHSMLNLKCSPSEYGEYEILKSGKNIQYVFRILFQIMLYI